MRRERIVIGKKNISIHSKSRRNPGDYVQIRSAEIEGGGNERIAKHQSIVGTL